MNVVLINRGIFFSFALLQLSRIVSAIVSVTKSTGTMYSFLDASSLTTRCVTLSITGFISTYTERPQTPFVHSTRACKGISILHLHSKLSGFQHFDVKTGDLRNRYSFL